MSGVNAPAEPMLETLDPKAAAALAAKLRANVERVLRGKPGVVQRAVETLIGGGHLLLEDVPGVGKTTLAAALARSVDASFRRVQFTSDLLPSDVVGTALLEAMAEGAVTVDGRTHPLPQPFFVVATQNPLEHHGTNPLPESQLDRFQMRLSIGYPASEDEAAVLREDPAANELPELRPVLTPHDVLRLR